jgi:short-subunit dehydrogenase
MKSSVKTTCICPYFVSTPLTVGMRPGFLSPKFLTPSQVARRTVKAIQLNEELAFCPSLYLKFILGIRK